jgi:V/A-type H+/Na+-transporting ATPase subunit E
MSSIEHTVRVVSDEALEEMKKELNGGKSSASEAISQRVNDTLAEVQQIDEEEERQADALKRQIIGGAEMSARNKSLEIIEDYMNEAFSRSMSKLSDLTTSPDYERIIRGMIIEAIDQIGGDSFVVQCASKDRNVVDRALRKVAGEKRVRLSLEEGEGLRNTVGGVIVKTTDGFVTFDNTFEAKLERQRPTLRKQIAQLFAEIH